MDSKENNLIELKETFWGKFVNNVKVFFSGIFSRKEILEEINVHNEDAFEVSYDKENISNNIAVEHIDVSHDDKIEIKESELSLEEKLEKLLKENKELEIILNDKFKELKEIRIKELKITLEIYKIEETYLKKYKMKISV